MSETKSEIRARIQELEHAKTLRDDCDAFNARISELKQELTKAEEDLFASVLQSHRVLCAVKQMDEKAAYGQDPAVYYTMAVSGESGEMANKIVKALRNGDDPDACRNAVISELPDVIIYSAVLAHVLDIDLTKLVNDKVKVVITRAESGYYGGALNIGAKRPAIRPADIVDRPVVKLPEAKKSNLTSVSNWWKRDENNNARALVFLLIASGLVVLMWILLGRGG
jgi:NTP pyrophosphatase (non-canonical NTP hydrolase)